MSWKSLDAFFKPSSVAVIGASQKELSIGNVIIKNLQTYGYKGKIFPVNPKVNEIRGLKAYPSILDVPERVDLAHIVIPPPLVPDEVENCGKKGVKGIIINTAGFKEMGGEGKALEDDFLARAKKYNIRIFGPNCQGAINSDPQLKSYCNFTFTYPEAGFISVVAQSGGVGAVIMQALHDMGIGLRMYSSNGNASDVSIPEIVEYYGHDEGTRVIVLYVESLENPGVFMKIAREVTRKKPVLALTAGTTEKGAEASRSHIGGMAGSISMDLIFEKTGILAFDNQEQMCHAAVAFAYQPIPRGKRVGVITNTGGPSVIAIDELVRNGLEIPPLSEKAKEELSKTMFSSASIANPLDVVATARAEQFRSAFDTLMNEPQLDSIYVNFVTPPFVDCESVAHEFVKTSEMYDKPIVCNYMTDKQRWKETTRILKEGGIPCYDYAESAAQALAALVRYHQISSRPEGSTMKFHDIKTDEARKIFTVNKGKSMVPASDAYRLLECYGIPVAPWLVSDNIEELIGFASRIGYPVVLKADAEDIIHKTEAGAVKLHILNQSQLYEEILQMRERLKMKHPRFLVQKQMEKGLELIASARKEKGLGHILMFGLGGIFVELFKDVTFKIAPITDTEADEMLHGFKSSVLLNGYRGQKGVNKSALKEILGRLSVMVEQNPEIIELDINPLIAWENRACAVDIRIAL